MSYKTYAEAKIANPDCEIVTTGKDWPYNGKLAGLFQALDTSDEGQRIHNTAWVICNPADYCSTLKEFLEAGLKLVKGDKFIGVGWYVVSVQYVINSNKPEDEDAKRYILSASALNGGCNIPKSEVNNVNYTIEELRRKYVKAGTKECEIFLTACANIGVAWSDKGGANDAPKNAEFIGISLLFQNEKVLGHCRKQYWVERGFLPFTPKVFSDSKILADEGVAPWTVYNNTLPLSELNYEQAGRLVKHSGEIEHMNKNTKEWGIIRTPTWNHCEVYRAKPKSEHESFIDKSIKLVTTETYDSMDKIFGAQFDAGARYKDLTQHFGENI